MIIVGVGAIVSAAAALLFLPAGRLDIPSFWAWLGVFALSGSATLVSLRVLQPALLAERMRPPSDRDLATRRIILPFVVAHLVVAGLDVGRHGWSPVPGWLSLLGLGLFGAGFALVAWTLLTNPFASSAVRVQTDRDQRVIQHGPYGLVRHPMYLAVGLVCVGSGPGLGSCWAGLLLLPVMMAFVRRTLLEDRMLHEELAGYPAYAQVVRWRVLPGVF